MKKVTLIALFAIAGFVANAQKGSILLSGDFGFKSEGVEKVENNTNTYQFNPQIGYGVTNNLHVGIISKLGYYSNGTNNGNTVLVGPFVRHTKMFGEIFGLIAEGHLGWLSQYDDVTASLGSQSGFQFGIAPRALVNVNKGFGLTFGFGGVNYQALGFNGAQATTFDINFGKQWSVGVQKVFGGKK